MVHDRKNTHSPLNQDGGSVHVVTRKLDLRSNVNGTYIYGKHKINVIRLTFRLQISIWIILMTFVTQNST